MENFEKLLNKTYRFLSYRPRSEKEIRDYLKKKKSDDLTLEKIIQKLKEHKFINDSEFTKWWIEQRTRIKPKALRVIKFELKQKGIDKELIEEILGNLGFELESELEKARKLAEKKMSRYSKIEDKRKVYEKMTRFLASKGFGWDTIKQVIDQILPKGYNN